MFLCTAVLAFALVIGNPAVLCGGFAILCQFGFVVNRAAGVVVLNPADASDMADIHIEALKADAGGDEAIQLSGFDLGIKQAVLQPQMKTISMSSARCYSRGLWKFVHASFILITTKLKNQFPT